MRLIYQFIIIKIPPKPNSPGLRPILYFEAGLASYFSKASTKGNVIQPPQRIPKIRGNHSPFSGIVSPSWGITSQSSGRVSPILGIVSLKPRIVSPGSGKLPPKLGNVSPSRGTLSPSSGVASPTSETTLFELQYQLTL